MRATRYREEPSFHVARHDISSPETEKSGRTSTMVRSIKIRHSDVVANQRPLRPGLPRRMKNAVSKCVGGARQFQFDLRVMIAPSARSPLVAECKWVRWLGAMQSANLGTPEAPASPKTDARSWNLGDGPTSETFSFSYACVSPALVKQVGERVAEPSPNNEN